jgi:hypothetical protein
MAKAHLRKAENWQANGLAIARTRELSGLSLKLFAAAVKRDERQVARWVIAAERPQLETVFAAPALRALLVIALAEQAGLGVDVQTTITVKRIA